MPDRLDIAVQRTRRRLWVRSVARTAAVGVVGGTVPLVVMALGGIDVAGLPITTLGLSVLAWCGAIAWWQFRHGRVPSDVAVIWLDRALGGRDLLPSAWHAEGDAEEHLRAQANGRLAGVAALPRPAWPVRAMSLALVAVMLLVTVVLLRPVRPANPQTVADGGSTGDTDEVFARPPRAEPPSASTLTQPMEESESDARDGASAIGELSGNVPAIGDNAAETDTLNVTTPKRENKPATADGETGTGGNAVGDGTNLADGNAGADPATPSPTDADADGDDSASPLPPHLRDLIDAYYR
ncbi:MAG: hypothetical protein AAGD32_04415 [Planctomycetota bacterium]